MEDYSHFVERVRADTECRGGEPISDEYMFDMMVLWRAWDVANWLAAKIAQRTEEG